MNKTLIFAAALGLSGCAGMSTMEKRVMDDAAYPSQTFAAPKAEVVKAATGTINVLGYNLKKVTEGEPTSVYFSKPVSAFSWGEVGRIDIESLGESSTRAVLASEKRSQMQITGTKQSEFATRIFGEMESRLKH